MSNNLSAVKAVIVGLEGLTPNDLEVSLFKQHNPLGFILFARNIQQPEQVKALVKQLRQIVGRDDAPVLIDQEGGRVARLRPPYFRSTFPAGNIATLALKDKERAKKAAYLSGRLIGQELSELGINVDCAPVADLLVDGAHSIIGDRAYGSTPEQVIALASEVARGLADSGVISIVKHIPGHGRALVDSHEQLPVVTESFDVLEKTDFKAFTGLTQIPWAMTAHVVYRCLDVSNPATWSPRVIRFIREQIGYDGIIISDDLSMKALTGSFAERAQKAIDAGCDLLLHCNGDLKEMTEVLQATPFIGMQTAQRLGRSYQFASAKPSLEQMEAERELIALV